jgi:hypothetical protein
LAPSPQPQCKTGTITDYTTIATQQSTTRNMVKWTEFEPIRHERPVHAGTFFVWRKKHAGWTFLEVKVRLFGIFWEREDGS